MLYYDRRMIWYRRLSKIQLKPEFVELGFMVDFLEKSFGVLLFGDGNRHNKQLESLGILIVMNNG